MPRIHAGQHAFVRLANGEFPGEVHEVHDAEVIIYFESPEAVTALGTAAQVRIIF
jgi:hypothetical protein